MLVPAEESKLDGDTGSQLLSSEFRISSDKTVEKPTINQMAIAQGKLGLSN